MWYIFYASVGMYLHTYTDNWVKEKVCMEFPTIIATTMVANTLLCISDNKNKLISNYSIIVMSLRCISIIAVLDVFCKFLAVLIKISLTV